MVMLLREVARHVRDHAGILEQAGKGRLLGFDDHLHPCPMVTQTVGKIKCPPDACQDQIEMSPVVPE